MKLFYRKEGEGPAIVIVHGLYGSSDNWINIGKRLAEYHTVYIIDQRNHGRSPFSESHSYKDMKDDLVDFFFSHKIESATLLGHSMGGKSSMWFAAEYPEKVEKLVVADIAPKNYLLPGNASQFMMHKKILQSMSDINFNLVNKRSDVEKILSNHIGDVKIRKFLLKNIARDKKSGLYKWRLNVPVLYEYLEEIVGGVNESWFDDRKPVSGYPVIFIRGMNSDYILPEDENLIKSIYPEASIVDIPDAGHWLHAENPQKFEKAVLRCC